MKLSDRLQRIADRVQPGETMADIGTDHGFLPLYLLLNEICPRVILVDVSEGSLRKAAENCARTAQWAGRDLPADLRLGDGLDALAPGEADVVVMAGIGGQLICDILDWDHAKSRSMPRYILQPRNHPALVRKWLYHHGFSIAEETLVPEGKYICEILTVTSGPGTGSGGTVPTTEETAAVASEEREAAFWYPDHLLRFRNAWTEPYLLGKLRLEEQIRENITLHSQHPHRDRVPVDARIRQLHRLLDALQQEESHEQRETDSLYRGDQPVGAGGELG